MYPEFAFPDLVGELEHHVTTARKGFEHGHLEAATHLVAASVPILEEITRRVDEMVQAMRDAFNALPVEVRARMLLIQGSEKRARAWFETPNSVLHGRTPAEVLATAEGRGWFLDMTCNVNVREQMEAYQSAQAGRRLELKLPESASWSPEGSGMDAVRRGKAIRGEP